ncbi:hypothetical protein [Natrinema sp. CGMCC1.2065]|uniref:hypothetical protein n=1 Tax=Natrinema sp. CGMCC1.2065 TaxID=3445767 RepID=UPI003F4A1C66
MKSANSEHERKDQKSGSEYLEWLFDLELESVAVEPIWRDASEHVLEYNPALGDSFALATAVHVDGTVLVGGDDDYDEITAVPIERFRDGSS